MRWLSIIAVTAGIAGSSLAEGSKVTFRKDHTILVDNQPFFPIGLYYCSEEFEDPGGKLLKELKDYGFNTLGYYRWGTPHWREELARAHQHGFKVWIRGIEGFAVDTPAIEKAVLEQVKQTKAMPALLFWEFQDEPLLNKVSIEGSRKGYQLVKREDPDHPMLVVEWPGSVSRLHLWKGIGDIFSFDLYPIPRKRGYGRLPNHDITQMRDYIPVLRQAHGDKPVLLVLQAWAWEPLKDGKKGYPTPQESRFMVYQAVVHGAKGIHYYGQFHCTQPNSASALYSEAKDPAVRKAEFEKCLELNRWFWDQQRDFFKELSAATRIFVLPDARPGEKIVCSEKTIESVTKQSGNRRYLLAVNASSQSTEATFRLPKNLQLVEMHVLFENRRVPVKDGSFADKFQPYDVHVYSSAAGLPKD